MNKFFQFLERLIYPMAVFTAALGLAYWYWTTTPSYALTAAVVSVQNRDVPMFEKYIDINSVTSHAFDDLLAGPVSSELLGRQNSFLGMGFVRYFKRELVELAHGKVVEFVENGKLKFTDQLPGGVNPLTAMAIMNSGQLVRAADGRTSPTHSSDSTTNNSTPKVTSDDAWMDDETRAFLPVIESPSQNKKSQQLFKEYGITRHGYRGIKYLNVTGSKADLGIEFFSPKLNQNWVINWQLEDVGGYWRITKLSNLRELVKRYMDNRDK